MSDLFEARFALVVPSDLPLGEARQMVQIRFSGWTVLHAGLQRSITGHLVGSFSIRLPFGGGA